MDSITIKTDSINLDQLLKWANVVGSGGEAKMLIQSSEVKLNGEVETRRSKKVFPGDTITISDQYSFIVQGND